MPTTSSIFESSNYQSLRGRTKLVEELPGGIPAVEPSSGGSGGAALGALRATGLCGEGRVRGEEL